MGTKVMNILFAIIGMRIFAGKITWPKTINSTAKATPNAPCLCLDLVEMSRVPVIHNMSWY